MEIYPDTKVYILTPSHVLTGGPTSAHQLCYKLRLFNINAYVTFFTVHASDTNSPQVPEAYRKYNNPTADFIEDNERNILIMPEVFLVSDQNEFTKIRKAVWWLSVDNYISGIYIAVFNHKTDSFFNIFSGPYKDDAPEFTHLTNSHYAREFLELASVPRRSVYRLESYIDSAFTETSSQKKEIKTNTVTYNPKKGKAFTKKIIDFCSENGKNIKFLPLDGLTPDEVSGAFAKSKVYMDFGGHPGRERMPREAAVNGCCVITNRRGSAKYYGDIPIPDKYKFEDDPENIPAIAARILNCFENYDDCVKDFYEYKEFVLNLETNFEKQIKDIFRIVN